MNQQLVDSAVSTLALHFMVLHGLSFHRFKSACAYMQRYKIPLNIFYIQFFK